jgi:hypothetical protein
MSCNHTDPCKDPCNADPCYDNCGCLNPTTFECVTKPGNYHHIKVTNDMNGRQVISSIDNKVAELEDISGKVLIDDQDFCPSNLINKIKAGQNISITQVGDGCDKRLLITAGTGIGPAGVDVNVKVTANDTTSSFLNNKVEVGPLLSKSVIGGIGNQRLRIETAPLINYLSSDSGNALTLGSDGKIKTTYTAPNGSETKIQTPSVGALQITGTGTNADPYVIIANPAIFPIRNSFDNTWKKLPLVSGGGVTIQDSPGAYFRYRFDGSVEFKGRVTANVTFPATASSVSADSLFTFLTGGTNPIASAAEISRSSILKSISSYNGVGLSIYNIKVESGKLGIRFIYTGPTASTVTTRDFIVDFDSAVYHLDI